MKPESAIVYMPSTKVEGDYITNNIIRVHASTCYKSAIVYECSAISTELGARYYIASYKVRGYGYITVLHQ